MEVLLIFGVKLFLVIIAVNILMNNAANLYLETKKELKDGNNQE